MDNKRSPFVVGSLISKYTILVRNSIIGKKSIRVATYYIQISIRKPNNASIKSKYEGGLSAI